MTARDDASLCAELKRPLADSFICDGTDATVYSSRADQAILRKICRIGPGTLL
jgi:hypothetical protein